MSSIYFVDEVDVIDVTHDVNGVESVAVRSALKVRVAERNRLVINAKGEEVVSSMQVLLSYADLLVPTYIWVPGHWVNGFWVNGAWAVTGSTFSLNYDSRIKVKKLRGLTYSLANKEWQIKAISTGGTFRRELVEAWL